MNDTNQPVPDVVVQNPSGASDPPNQPQGSFVIADLPVTQNQTSDSTTELPPADPVSNLIPRMSVETVPDEPQPQSPIGLSEATQTPSVSNIATDSTILPTDVSVLQPSLDSTTTSPGLSNQGDLAVSIPPQESMVLSPQETVVIPTMPTEQNFVPQGLEQPQTAAPLNSSNNNGKSRSGLFKYLVIFLVVLLLAGVGFLGFRLVTSMVSDNTEATVVYWGLWEDSDVIKPMIARFEQENPKIKIDYKEQNIKQYKERLEAAVNRGEGPDVFRFHTTWIPMLRNQIEPVPESIVSVSQFKNSYYPVMANDLVVGTTVWGLPTMVEGLGLYVNKSLFAAAGVSVPKTYEDLLSIVPRLTVRSDNEIVTSAIALGSGRNIEHVSDILSLMILQNGGNLANPTTQEVEEALVFFRKFSNPSDPLYTWNDQQDNSIAAFANGRVAMIFAPSWRAHEIKTINPTLDFEIAPVPQLPGSTITWASYWAEGVSTQSKHKDKAFVFLRYLASQEAVSLVSAEAGKMRLFGAPPALKSLGTALQTDPFVGAYIKQAATAQSFPLASNTYDNGLNDQMVSYMKNAINAYSDGSSPSQVLDTMNKGFQQLFSRYGLVSSN